AIQQLVTSQRRYLVGQVFLMLWIGFVIVAFLSMFVTWLALSFFYGEVVAVVPILVQFLLTVALFPLPAWCLIRLQRAFLSQEAPT
ncbi:MAG: rod shape-determining protein MreD, partial [Bdellovibrionales bacterium]